MSETTVVLSIKVSEPLAARKLASLSLFRVVPLLGHPPSLHPIYKDQKDYSQSIRFI